MANVYIACCKSGVLQNIIVAPDLAFAQTNLNKQFDTFFDVTAQHTNGTAQDLNNFLISKGISIPVSTDSDPISDLKIDVKQLAVAAGITPTKPLG